MELVPARRIPRIAVCRDLRALKKILLDFAVALRLATATTWAAVTNDAFSLSFSLMIAMGIFCYRLHFHPQ